MKYLPFFVIFLIDSYLFPFHPWFQSSHLSLVLILNHEEYLPYRSPYTRGDAHPDPLVQSSALARVEPPPTTYEPTVRQNNDSLSGPQPGSGPAPGSAADLARRLGGIHPVGGHIPWHPAYDPDALYRSEKEKRDAFFARVDALKIPPNPLDEIIDRLGGPDKVAGNTVRHRHTHIHIHIHTHLIHNFYAPVLFTPLSHTLTALIYFTLPRLYIPRMPRLFLFFTCFCAHRADGSHEPIR